MSNIITLGNNSSRISLINKNSENITLEERAQNRINILERERIELDDNIELIKLVKNGCNLFWAVKEW